VGKNPNARSGAGNGAPPSLNSANERVWEKTDKTKRAEKGKGGEGRPAECPEGGGVLRSKTLPGGKLPKLSTIQPRNSAGKGTHEDLRLLGEKERIR